MVPNSNIDTLIKMSLSSDVNDIDLAKEMTKSLWKDMTQEQQDVMRVFTGGRILPTEEYMFLPRYRGGWINVPDYIDFDTSKRILNDPNLIIRRDEK